MMRLQSSTHLLLRHSTEINGTNLEKFIWGLYPKAFNLFQIEFNSNFFSNLPLCAWLLVFACPLQTAFEASSILSLFTAKDDSSLRQSFLCCINSAGNVNTETFVMSFLFELCSTQQKIRWASSGAMFVVQQILIWRSGRSGNLVWTYFLLLPLTQIHVGLLLV